MLTKLLCCYRIMLQIVCTEFWSFVGNELGCSCRWVILVPLEIGLIYQVRIREIQLSQQKQWNKISWFPPVWIQISNWSSDYSVLRIQEIQEPSIPMGIGLPSQLHLSVQLQAQVLLWCFTWFLYWERSCYYILLVTCYSGIGPVGGIAVTVESIRDLTREMCMYHSGELSIL